MFERTTDAEKNLIIVNKTNEEKNFKVSNEYEKSNTVYTLKKSKPGTLAPYGAISIKKKY